MIWETFFFFFFLKQNRSLSEAKRHEDLLG